MNNKLLGMCAAMTLSFFGAGSVFCAESDSATVNIDGEIKAVIVVVFSDQEQTLKLYDDKGDKTRDEDRTFSFYITRFTSKSAKLKLEPEGEGISLKDGKWTISKVKDGSNGDKDKYNLTFRLEGPGDSSGVQKAWEDGCSTYSFKEGEKVLGEWKIIVDPDRIERQSSGKYSGKLKVSVSATD